MEEIIEACKLTQSSTDVLIENVVKKSSELSFDAIDKAFNIAINNYNGTISSLETLLNNNNELQNIQDLINDSNKRKNIIISLKAITLGKKIKSRDCTSILTLSNCVVYRWKEDDVKGRQDIEFEIIEKEILGEGPLYLLKAKNTGDIDLHFIQIAFKQQEDKEEDEDDRLRFAITSQTPILLFNKGHYVLQLNGYFYGIILPETIPQVYIDVLEKQLALISYFGVVKQQSPTLPAAASSTTTAELPLPISLAKEQDEVGFAIKSLKMASSGVDSGSQTIRSGILAASSSISSSLRSGGFVLKSNLEKHKTATVVSPFVLEGVGYLKSATGTAKSGSSFVIDSLAGLIEGVGTGLIAGVKMIVPESTKNENNETMNAALDFGKTSIKAIGSIIDAFSEGVTQIYTEATSTTESVLEHKYGEYVAKVGSDTMGVGKHIFDTATTLSFGSSKAIAFKIAKNGGTKIIETEFNLKDNKVIQNEEQEQEQEQEQQEEEEEQDMDTQTSQQQPLVNTQ
ncbi:hypothetical protein CYY_005138 [Polysphondylium violaceum]|uniref:Senescence domain-containing protein n=1 Tax=Polysphondylium violaceum TaxID=133409 RepID=A0A8J4PTF5_9MYCE|nr:hypothetical protein CYY_005138 [Polysphondylium violaceum]